MWCKKEYIASGSLIKGMFNNNIKKNASNCELMDHIDLLVSHIYHKHNTIGIKKELKLINEDIQTLSGNTIEMPSLTVNCNNI